MPGRCLACLAAVAFLAGCDVGGGYACTAESVPGLSVRVLDAATGAPLACSAVLVARDRGFTDSVSVATWLGRPPSDTTGTCALWPAADVLSAAHERPGVYEVRVERAGYRPWTRTGVRVTADRCHVRTVHLDARLERDTSAGVDGVPVPVAH